MKDFIIGFVIGVVITFVVVTKALEIFTNKTIWKD